MTQKLSKLTLDEFEKIIDDLNKQQSYFLDYEDEKYEILYSPKFDFNQIEFIIKDLYLAMEADQLREEKYFTSDEKLGEFINLLTIVHYTDFYDSYKDAPIDQFFALLYVLKSRGWFDEMLMDMFNRNEVGGVIDKVFESLNITLKYMSTETTLANQMQDRLAEFQEKWSEILEKEV